MNHHRLSTTEYLITIILALIALHFCFTYLQAELVTLITQTFDSLPREFRP